MRQSSVWAGAGAVGGSPYPGVYDLEVDTSRFCPLECALQIKRSYTNGYRPHHALAQGVELSYKAPGMVKAMRAAQPTNNGKELKMNITVRALDPVIDYPGLVSLLNQIRVEPITVELLREEDQQAAKEEIRQRKVVVSDDNQVCGYSIVHHDPWVQAGHFYLWVAVDPQWRQQGLGALLSTDALRFAQEQGATRLYSSVREEHTEGLRFAERRGFAIDRHLFESVLDLHTFDEQRFAGVVETVAATGIRFFSLAEAGDTPQARRKLYEVNSSTDLDLPGATGDVTPFEEFSKHVFAASWFRPEGQLLAAHGDEFVGLSAVGYFQATNSMYNMHTGVIRAYRGRRIAQALKLLALRFAKAYGADYIRTHNDSKNAPMLAINRKLGYAPTPGMYRLVKTL